MAADDCLFERPLRLLELHVAGIRRLSHREAARAIDALKRLSENHPPSDDQKCRSFHAIVGTLSDAFAMERHL